MCVLGIEIHETLQWVELGLWVPLQDSEGAGLQLLSGPLKATHPVDTPWLSGPRVEVPRAGRHGLQEGKFPEGWGRKGGLVLLQASGVGS